MRINTKIEEVKDWKENEEMLQLYEEFLQGSPSFPVTCPVCSKKGGHVYLDRDENSERGGMWCWCSECKSFIHAESYIPKWWFNPTFIEESELCAGDADELERNVASIDDLVNELLRDYCFSKNVCRYCIQKEYELPKTDKCPDCGKQTMMVTLDGPCMLASCSNCGFKVVGASYFPPCHNDRLEYTVTVRSVEKEKKILVAKLFGINVKKLLDTFREKNELKISLEIDETMILLHGLKELNVTYEVAPDIEVKYPDIMSCKHRY